MHGLRCPNYPPAQGFGNCLMPQTDPQQGQLQMEFSNDVQRAAGISGPARPWRKYHAIGTCRANPRDVDLRVPHYASSVSQSLEIPSQVIDEAVVVID